jgi:putative oxidoreductase
LQRLYSTFANGFPGKGLLILRLTVSTFLICDARAAFLEPRQATGIILALIAAAVGILLCIGLWTPVAGTLVAFAELSLLFLRQSTLWSALLATAIVTALALLGPGSWSIDSHRYGRKRISVSER